MTVPRPDLLRLFVAIELPGEVQEALRCIQDDLRQRGLERLRWVRPQGIHLTLKFLGETQAERVPAVLHALAQAVDGLSSHHLWLGGLGVFGGARPRVVWVDLKGDIQRLQDLQQQIDTMLANAGFPRESRAFSPHLTLARVRPETAHDLAATIAEAFAAVEPPGARVAVGEISLMRSILGSGGAVYERLAAFPLT